MARFSLGTVGLVTLILSAFLAGPISAGTSGSSKGRSRPTKKAAAKEVAAAEEASAPEEAAPAKATRKRAAAKAEPSTVDDVCAALFDGDAKRMKSAGVHEESKDFASYTTTYSLLDFFGTQGLALQRPLIGMNAAQTFLAFIYSQPRTSVTDYVSASRLVTVYDFFTKASPHTGKRRVIDRDRIISSVVDQVRTQAVTQHGPGAKKVLIYGPPGTGKSEILEVARERATTLPLTEPRYQLFSFRWKNLNKIPRLAPLIHDPDGRFFVPTAQSPIQLLPDGFREAYLQKIDGLAREMIEMSPVPYIGENGQNRYIRHEVLEHEAKQRGLGALTPAQEMAILNDYVDIFPLDKQALESKFALISRQGKPVKYQDLYWRDNLAISMTQSAAHPLAKFLDGKLTRASDGGFVLIDEVLKNEKDLLAKMLTFLQSGRLEEGGYELQTDVVVVLATNTQDQEEVKAEDPQSPLLSRADLVPSPWLTRPASVAATLMYESRDLVQVEKLPREHASDAGGKVKRLITDPNLLDEMFKTLKGDLWRTGFPEGNYSIWYGGQEPGRGDTVHIAPHALFYLAAIAALTRNGFDPALLQEHKIPVSVLNEAVFREPMTRLRYLLGRLRVSPTQVAQMERLSVILKEGSFGIDHRVVTGILNDAKSEAARNEGCITAELIRNVLKRRWQEDALNTTHEEGLRWLQYAAMIDVNFLVHNYMNDLRYALLGEEGQRGVSDIYRQIIQELNALSEDPDAESYTHEGSSHTIKRGRLKKIQEIFYTNTGKVLDLQEISRFHGLSFAVRGELIFNELHEGLKDAIVQWQQEEVTSGIAAAEGGLEHIVAVGAGRQSGTERQRTVASTLQHNLHTTFGYCPVCSHKAIQRIDAHLHHLREGR